MLLTWDSQFYMVSRWEGSSAQEAKEAHLPCQPCACEGKSSKNICIVLMKPWQLRKLAFAVINSTTILLPAWKACLEELYQYVRIMPHDVRTWWNLTYDMLKFALEYKETIKMLTSDLMNSLWNCSTSHLKQINCGQLGVWCKSEVQTAQRTRWRGETGGETTLAKATKFLMTSSSSSAHWSRVVFTGTGKRPEKDRTLTNQDWKFPGPIKTVTVVQSLVHPHFGKLKTDKDRSSSLNGLVSISLIFTII